MKMNNIFLLTKEYLFKYINVKKIQKHASRRYYQLMNKS